MSFQTKLVLGTVQFGLDYGVANTIGRVSAQEAGNILKRASALGIDTLDTATDYGDSETVLGQLGVQGWNMITKLPAVPDACREIERWVAGQVEESIKRLGVKQLYGLLLHRPNQLLTNIGPTLYAVPQSFKRRGLVRKVGVSVYSISELEVLSKSYEFDLVQAPLNILDRGLVDSGWASRLRNTGVEVHVRSVFLQGLLLMPLSQRPAKFERWANIWAEWDRWLTATELTPLQACLRYVNGSADIDRIVVGVTSVAQLEEVVAASIGQLNGLPEFSSLSDKRIINPSSWGQL